MVKSLNHANSNQNKTDIVILIAKQILMQVVLPEAKKDIS